MTLTDTENGFLYKNEVDFVEKMEEIYLMKDKLTKIGTNAQNEEEASKEIPQEIEIEGQKFRFTGG